MIPKIIHYVWVGHNPKSKIIKECIATWKKNLPAYQFIEWNEDNFDMKINILSRPIRLKNGPLFLTIFVHGQFMSRVVFIWIPMCA